MNSIREKRIEAGMTQKQLADTLAIDRTTVTQWELGRSNPTASRLKDVAAVLGCTVDELLRKEGKHDAERDFRA